MQRAPAKMQLGWDDLRVFLAAHRGRTLAAAGRALGMDATTVGRRLVALEEAAGTRLFQRTGDGLLPTPAAEAIVEATQVMERQADLVARQMTGADHRLEGLVRLAVTDQFASHFLVSHLAAFNATHPHIEIELVTGVGFADLARGDADVAVRFAQPGKGVPGAQGGGQSVLAQRVGSIGVAVFASAAYLRRTGAPRDAQDVGGHSLVLPRASAGFLPGSEWFQVVEKRADVRVALRSDGLAGMAAATAAGLGLCALPVFMAPRYPELVRVGSSLVAARDIWLLVAADLRRVARVVAVRELLLGVLTREADALHGQAPAGARAPAGRGRRR